MIEFNPDTTDEDKVKILEDIINRIFREWMLACQVRDDAVARAAGAKADWQACYRNRNQLLSNNHELHRQIVDLHRQIEELQEPGLLSQQSHMAKSVDDLDLSVRAANCLQALQIATISELTFFSEAELLKQKYLTKKVVKEIRTELAKLRLKLKGDK